MLEGKSRHLSGAAAPDDEIQIADAQLLQKNGIVTGDDLDRAAGFSERNPAMAFGMILTDTVGKAPTRTGGPARAASCETESTAWRSAVIVAPAWRRNTSP